MEKQSQDGRSVVLVLLCIVAAVIVSLIGWRLWEYQRHAQLRTAISEFKEGHYNVAVVSIRANAVNGDVLARRTLGEMYAFGLGVPQDSIQARTWLRRAECRCDNPGQYEYDVALNYLNGYAGKQDKGLAFTWLQYAAEAGHSRAQELIADSTRLQRMGFSADAATVEYWKRATGNR